MFKLRIELPESITKKELADSIYGHLTYDLALPQSFVDYCLERGFDPRPDIVWLYAPNDLIGFPAPLTLDALRWMVTYDLLNDYIND